MRIISWNCQGLLGPMTKASLFRICRIYKPLVLFLVETLNKCEVVHSLACSLGFPNVITQPPQGRSGGLALLWSNKILLSLLFKDERLIDVHVRYNKYRF